MLSPVLPSARLSVTRVDQSKMVEVRIIQFSAYGSPIPLVFACKFNPEILTGSPERPGASNMGGETSHFLALNQCQHLENGRRYVQRPKLLLTTNRKSHALSNDIILI